MGLSSLILRALATTGVLGFALLSCAQGSTALGIAGGVGGAAGSGGSPGAGGRGSTSAGTEVTSSTTAGGGAPSTSGAGGAPVTVTGNGGSPSFSSSSTTTTSSSGGPSSACDSVDCGTCGACAECSVCSNQENACIADCDCSFILFCILDVCDPGDTVCEQACVDADPGEGATLFNQLNMCLNCACVETCAIPPGYCP